MTIPEHEQKIREVATVEYKIEPQIAKALYLQKGPDGLWQVCFISPGLLSGARLRHFANWVHKNRIDLLPGGEDESC
jgi:hypothetical protein